MKVSKNAVVSVSYQLFVGDEGEKEELMEQTKKSQPFKFTCGTGAALEKFEENLMGLSTGDSFDFYIECEDAYGEYDEDKVVTVPKSTFLVDGEIDEEELFVDNIIPMSTEDGEKHDAVIIDITEDEVELDFNHLLAGERLHFVGTIVDVRTIVTPAGPRKPNKY